MTVDNPYQTPPTDVADPVKSTTRWIRVLAGVLLFIGALFLLLLNGQHFTNRIVFLGFATASTLLWYRYRLLARSQNPDAGRVAIIFHLILLLAFSATLPDAYSRQKQFNRDVQQIKSRLPAK